MNIQKRLRMDLEQALLTYGNDIDYIILRDGTSIEIIDDNDNDYVEEKMEDNYDNYMYKEINQDGTLRGKGLKKPLRKTVLKSSMGNNQGNLRNIKNKNNNEKNVIVKISENNEYLQCANCFKFFNSKETEEETDNTSENNYNANNDINNNNQINNNFINQNQPNIPRQVIPQYQGYDQNNNKGNQPYFQPHPKYNQNNIQPYYPRNTNNNQYPPQIPRGPQPQHQYYYNNQIPKGNPKMPYYNNNQNNPLFRSRKSNEFIQKNNMVNRYPGSAKKQRNTEINYDDNYYEYPATKYNNKNYFAHSSSKKQENNYYQNEIDEFQESEYYKF